MSGGAGKIADAMTSKLGQKVQYGKRVTAIHPLTSGGPTATAMRVTIAGESSLRTYSHVISTMPFSSLRMVDISQCGFNWTFQTAIRALHYDGSVKVAIRFSTRWWESTNFLNACPPQFGGVSSTDRPMRCVVYPSYGMGQPETGATLIVSYTWGQDALRLGTWAQGQGSEVEKQMLEMVLKDLADMHKTSYSNLVRLVIDHKVYNWYADQYSGG
jgi:monoamine oxidase